MEVVLAGDPTSMAGNNIVAANYSLDSNRQVTPGRRGCEGSCILYNTKCLGISRNFPAREYYHVTEAEKVLYPQIREIFMSRNCLTLKFAKFSCREIFLLYSINLSHVKLGSKGMIHFPSVE